MGRITEQAKQSGVERVWLTRIPACLLLEDEGKAEWGRARLVDSKTSPSPRHYRSRNRRKNPHPG